MGKRTLGDHEYSSLSRAPRDRYGCAWHHGAKPVQLVDGIRDRPGIVMSIKWCAACKRLYGLNRRNRRSER
jgi:hypothetical protein